MKTKTTTSPTNNNTDRLGEIIKLGVDVHEKSYVVVMKIDASAPLRAKRMTPEVFLTWIHQLRGRCESLYSCYEAGPFGYGLHRKHEAMGVTNYVIQPINWDEHAEDDQERAAHHVFVGREATFGQSDCIGEQDDWIACEQQ